MQLDRDFPHVPDLVALGREYPDEQPLLLGHPSQRRVALGRRFQLLGDTACAPQRLAAKTGNQGVKFDFQGQARIQRFSLALCQSTAAGREPSQRFAGARPAGGGAFEPAGQQAGAGAGPFRALSEQAAAARGAREAGPQAGHGGGGAAQAGTEVGEMGWAGGPFGRKSLAEPVQRPDGPLDRSRADHRPHLRAGCDATLRTNEQREPILGRDRALPGGGDDLERGLPTGADRAVDRFRALTGGT